MSGKNKTETRRRWEREQAAKLTPQDHLDIQQSTEHARIICKRYGVDHRTIYWVRMREQWKLNRNE